MIGRMLLSEQLEHGDVDLTVGDSLWSEEAYLEQHYFWLSDRFQLVLRSTMEDDPAMLMDAFRERRLTIGPEECSEFPGLDKLLGK